MKKMSNAICALSSEPNYLQITLGVPLGYLGNEPPGTRIPLT